MTIKLYLLPLKRWDRWDSIWSRLYFGLDVHQKQINESMIDREKNGSPKIAKDEYFNIISYDLNAAGFPSKKDRTISIIRGKKRYRGAYDINQYYADNKDYIPVTLYKVGNNG